MALMDHLDARIGDLAASLQLAASSTRDASESGLLAAAARSREDVRCAFPFNTVRL